MNNKKFSEYVQRLRKTLFARLERKTGWGKEEVKKEFWEAQEKVLGEMLDRD